MEKSNGVKCSASIDKYVVKSPKTVCAATATLIEGEKNDLLDLSNSSVLLTPENSPGKDEFPEKQEQLKDSVPHCKKALINGTTSETDSKCEKQEDSSQSKSTTKSIASALKQGKRRRQKNKKGKDSVTDSPVTKIEKSKTDRKKKESTSVPQNKLVTDFFPVRRSNRKCKSDLEKDNIKELQHKILSHCEEGLKVENIEGKGRGVVAQRDFSRGDFIVEYAGDLIDMETAKEREDFYSKDSKYGCYMYYFTHKEQRYCVDATIESGKLGRLINHSVKGNCYTKVVDIKDRPYLILAASTDLKKGTELLYDYGDRSKSSIESHPWLKS